MRRPVRRPSVDSCCSQALEETAPEHDLDHQSCSSDYSDFDDEATQVTSNHSVKKRGSNNTQTTAKSSHSGCVHHVEFDLTPTAQQQQDRPPTTILDNDFQSRADDLQSKPGEIVIGDCDCCDIGETDDAPIRILTEARVRSFMTDYYEDFASIIQPDDLDTRRECLTAFAEHYWTPDVCWMRPSGNPCGKEGLIKMMAEDVIMLGAALVSIDSIQLLAAGMAAVVVFTVDQEFEYKGSPESDRAIISAVLHMENDGREGIIRIGHEHRCSGKPIPKATRWESCA